TEKGLRAIERLKQRFGTEELPAAFRVLAGSENGISDLYMNLNRQLEGGKLDEKQKLTVALGVAAALGSAQAVDFFTNAALLKGRTKEECLDTIGVAGVCTLFNSYYRFKDQVPQDVAETYAN